MKLKKVLALLLVVLVLSGCEVQENPIQPEIPDQMMDESLQEPIQEPIQNQSDETSVQLEQKEEQQDEPREEVVNTESPAVKPEPSVSPKEEPSQPEQPAEPSEPEVTTPKDEPSIPVEPIAPIQPDLPEKQEEEKVEEEKKEDDLVPPSEEESLKEYIDESTLISAGLQYAADTYGYEISVGVRDGYYPAYQCVFDTMEEGLNCVKRCIDDTTRALLARPGTQIVVEIDGVLCRARIDITMKNLGDGTYSVTVYYG